MINHFLQLSELFVKTSNHSDQKCIYPSYFIPHIFSIIIYNWCSLSNINISKENVENILLSTYLQQPPPGLIEKILFTCIATFSVWLVLNFFFFLGKLHLPSWTFEIFAHTPSMFKNSHLDVSNFSFLSLRYIEVWFSLTLPILYRKIPILPLTPKLHPFIFCWVSVVILESVKGKIDIFLYGIGKVRKN